MYVISLVLLLAAGAWSTQMTLEGETRRGSTPVYQRSSASGQKTTYLHKGEELLLFFCLTEPTTVTIESVVYSNYGGPDELKVYVDDTEMGTFTTEQHSDWNEFYGTDPIGSQITLASGVHNLVLKVTGADDYGMEVDKVVLEVDDAFLSTDSKSFTCELPCLSSIEPLRNRSLQNVKTGYMKQNSSTTRCTEQDNVDIPIFHMSVKEFTVSATMPRYHSFANLRHDDTANCPFLPPLYWAFHDVSVNDLLHTPQRAGDVVLRHYSGIFSGASSLLQFRALFKLEGKSMGFIDSEIGSILKLSLGGLSVNALVSIRYKGRDASYTKIPAVKYTTNTPTCEWDITDFTWSETLDNEIILKIETNQKIGLFIGLFSLERRHMKPDTVFPIFKTEKINIEGINVDFWWRSPETMAVTLCTTDQAWLEVDYLRVALPVPWTAGSWGQVFVLYQDGNIRLLPLAPPGIDWIPFGTSVIVGQTNTKDFRPIAPISHVMIDPETLTLDIAYYDGGSVRINITSYLDTTTVRVSKIRFKQDRSKHPIATFRSMFVASGKNDADSVMTDLEAPKHVMGKWDNMTGTSFQVFRRCLTDHLTQSPDLRLDIIDG